VTAMGESDASSGSAQQGQGGVPSSPALPVCNLVATSDCVWRMVGGVWTLVPKTIVRGPYLEK